MFRQVMFQNFKDSSLQGMAKRLFSSNEMQDHFPQMLKLLTIALITLGAHAHEGYSTLSVCLSVTSLLASFHVHMTN